MNSRSSRILLGLVVVCMPFFSAACGSSYSANSGSGGGPGSPATGNLNLMVSDASTEELATI